MLPSLGFCSNLVIRVAAGVAQETGALAFRGVSGSDSDGAGGGEGGGQGRPPHLPAQAPGRPGRNEMWLPSTCLFQPHRSLHRALTSSAFPEKFCGAGSCRGVRACVCSRGGHRCAAREAPLPSASLWPTFPGPQRGTRGPGGRSW